jgi:hypothetical protein
MGGGGRQTGLPGSLDTSEAHLRPYRCHAGPSAEGVGTDTGWERTPWHATQRAAWEALKKVDAPA